jgi:hypothetical protein
MKINKLILITLVSFPIFFSCSNNDDVTPVPIPGAYENGFFVLNEGTAASGSVTYISNDLNTVKQDIYNAINPGDALGGYLQSIFFNEDKAYIISGSANSVTIVNKNTFKLISKIETGLKNPRYGVITNGKAYITNANSYDSTAGGNTDDYVAVVNLATNTVESKIALNTTGNRIVLGNNKLYITEPYNNSNILVINPDTNTLETPIVAGAGADTMQAKSGVLYVLTKTDLITINLGTNTVTKKLTFPTTLLDPNNLNIDGEKFYFNINKNIFANALSTDTISETPLFTTTATSVYGLSVKNNRIFIADAPNFTGNGKALIYSLTGTLQKEHTVGIGPNGFYFGN